MNLLTQNWLFELCKSIQGVSRAVVFLNVTDKEDYTPAAFWPKDLINYQQFTASAKIALTKSKCILQHSKDSEKDAAEHFDVIACPLIIEEQLYGVVVLQMSSRVSTKQKTAIQQVKSAAFWFGAMIKQRSSTEKNQLVTIVELVASCLEHERFQAAATDVMTDLTNRLSCDRVSIGFLLGHGVRVEAVSHSAGFDRKSSFIRDIGEAMHETMDQKSTIVYPETPDEILLTRCHAVLVEEHKMGQIITTPFVVGGKISGAVLAERSSSHPFDLATKEHLEHIVSMIGPVLDVRYRDEQWLPMRVRNSLKASLGKVFGPGYLTIKLSLAAIVFCLAFLSFTDGDYRVTGDARLEARTQRVLVASQDGYIASSSVRPGDIIHSGDILGALDDKDLKLEQRKWSSQLEQLQREYRAALASHDRSKVSIINAKVLQTEARLNLVREQLARTRFVAPFDGLIVSGDLNQALGSPVERGQVLFTVAPLIAYRVILKIDERDIGNLKEDQTGNLVLSGMPSKPFPFTVEKVTPVSTPEEGRNFFQVEAKMKENLDLLRPGMEGVAKINIDRRKLIWIWSHRLIDWGRLSLWAWRP